MSTEKKNSDNYRDDEIDLRKLFQAIGNGFSNIGRGFINVIIRIRRTSITYKYLIIIMAALGVVAGVAFNQIAKPVYSTSMLLSSDYFNNRLFENNVDKLNALCEEDNSSGLARLLDVEVEIAENIKKFELEPIVTEQDVVDLGVLKENLKKLKVEDLEIEKIVKQIEIQNNKTYRVFIFVYDNDIIGNLEESVVNYFRNEPFVKNRIEATKKSQLSLLKKLENDIEQLDSLKKLFNLNLKANASRKNETASLYVGESGLLNPVSFYSQSVKLYEKLEETEQKVMLGDDFELIDGFTTLSKPKSPGLVKASILAMFYFIGLAYLTILFIEINKHLNKVEKERFKKLEE